MNKLNGLILGVGNFANFPLQRFTKIQEKRYGQDLSERIGNLWLADIDESALNEKGEEFGIPSKNRIKIDNSKGIDKTILDKLNFAVVATPAAIHYDTTVPFIVQGIPTFLPKPIDIDYRRAKDLIALAEQHGTPNASGSQMMLHPAFVKAKEYIKEKEIKVKDVVINWVKERGPREHVIPGITIEEGPHPFGILSVLKQKMPYRVNAIARDGEIIITPNEWAKPVDKTGTEYKGETEYKDKKYILAEISKVSMANLKYRDGSLATVINHFENPRKARTVEIIGELPEGERYQRSVVVYVDLTDMKKKYVEPYKEHMPHIRKGTIVWQGCLDKSKKDRTGLGRIVLNESYEEADDIGAQFNAFLDWAETGKKPEYLATFADQFRSEKLIDAVNKSIAKDAEVRYNGVDYV